MFPRGDIIEEFRFINCFFLTQAEDNTVVFVLDFIFFITLNNQNYKKLAFN